MTVTQAIIRVRRISPRAPGRPHPGATVPASEIIGRGSYELSAQASPYQVPARVLPPNPWLWQVAPEVISARVSIDVPPSQPLARTYRAGYGSWTVEAFAPLRGDPGRWLWIVLPHLEGRIDAVCAGMEPADLRIVLAATCREGGTTIPTLAPYASIPAAGTLLVFGYAAHHEVATFLSEDMPAELPTAGGAP